MFAGRLLRIHPKRRFRAYCQSPAFENVLDRIVFNSVLQAKKAVQHWRKVNADVKSQKRIEMKCDVEPVTLQYLDEYIEQVETVEPDVVNEVKNTPYSLPYSIISKTNFNKNDEQIKDNDDNEINYDCKSRYGT